MKYFLYRSLTKRQSLDRRRFEAAHLRYAVLQVAAFYSELLLTQGLFVYPDVEKTLSIITPALYSAFQARFSGKHFNNFIYKITVIITMPVVIKKVSKHEGIT